MAATLLGLPPELRLSVYELLVADRCISFPDDNTEHCGSLRSAFALAQTCTAIRDELSPLLPAVAEVHFVIRHSSAGPVYKWVEAMGPDKIQQLHRITIHHADTPCNSTYDEGRWLLERAGYADVVGQLGFLRYCSGSVTFDFSVCTKHTLTGGSKTPETSTKTSRQWYGPCRWLHCEIAHTAPCSNGSNNCGDLMWQSLDSVLADVKWNAGKLEPTARDIRRLWTAVHHDRA